MTPTKHIWTTNEIEAKKKPRALAPYTPKYFVDLAKGLDTNEGKSASKPFRTVRKAGQVAAAGDTVEVRGQAVGPDAFYAPNNGVRFVGVIDAASGNPKLTRGVDDGIFILTDVSDCIFENFDVSGADYPLVLSNAHNSFFKNCDFQSCGGLKIVNGSSKNRFENFTLSNIGQPADNNTDGFALLDGASDNEFVNGKINNCGHSAFTSTFQNAAQRPMNKNFLFNIVINNLWSGGIITNGTDYNLYAEKITINNAGNSPQANGAGTRSGLQISGNYGTFKDFLIDGAAWQGIQILAYNYAGVNQLANGNLITGAVVVNCKGTAVQFGGRHGVVPKDNILDFCNFRGNAGLIETLGDRFNIEVEQYHEAKESLLWTPSNAFGNVIKNSIFDVSAAAANKSAYKVLHHTRRAFPDVTTPQAIENANAFPFWTGNKTSGVVTPPPNPVDPPPTVPSKNFERVPWSGKTIADKEKILNERKAAGWRVYFAEGTSAVWFEKVA